MTIEELRKKRADIWESAKKFLTDYAGGNPYDWVLRKYYLAIEEKRMLDAQIERMETAKHVTVDSQFYKCPSCGIILSMYDKKEDIEYCWHCDQKLDWGIEVGRDSEKSD